MSTVSTRLANMKSTIHKSAVHVLNIRTDLSLSTRCKMDKKTKFNSLSIWMENNLHMILNDPNFAAFFKWFEGNVTQENILSAEEIQMSDELKISGKFIEDPQELATKMKQMEIVQHKTFDKNKFESLQEKLEEVKKEEAFFKEFAAELSSTELKLDEEIRELKSKNHCLEQNKKSLIENCKGTAAALEDLQTENVKSLVNLRNCYNIAATPPLFWCHLDINEYCFNCEQFASILKISAAEKLKISNIIDDNVDENNDETIKMSYKLHKIKLAAFQKTIAKNATEADLYKLSHLIEILSGGFEPMSYSKISEQIERMSHLNETIEESLEQLRERINEKIEQYAVQEAAFCAYENNQEKCRNAEHRLEWLKKMHKPMNEGLLVSEVLWLLMNMEMENTKKVFQIVNKDENHRFARNVELLKATTICSSNDPVEKVFSTHVLDTITKFLVPDDCINDCFEVFNEATNNNAAKLHTMVSHCHPANIQEIIDDFNLFSQKINLLIDNGPIGNKPNLWNLSIIADEALLEHQNQSQNNISRKLRTEFMEEYHNPSTNDELWQRRQYFWIWFLTDETKFLDAFQKTIGELKKCKELKVIKPTKIGVSGIKRQQ